MKTSLAIGKSLAFLGGVALFAAVQAWLFQSTAPIAGLKDSGWFLNSGRGVGAVGLTFAVAGVLVGLSRRDGVIEATLITVGAAAAMIVVLFNIGPGTIFPIVSVVGAVIVGGATAIGTGLGIVVRRASLAWARQRNNLSNREHR